MTAVDLFLQQLINGLSLGAMYSLLGNRGKTPGTGSILLSRRGAF